MAFLLKQKLGVVRANAIQQLGLFVYVMQVPETI